MGYYDEMTIRSKSTIKRYAHNRRFELGVKLCEECSSVLDYGTGSAYFLKLLSEKNPKTELVGYEPNQSFLIEAQAAMRDYPNIKVVDSLSGLKRFDCITCFEVLEHLTEADQIKILRQCRELIKPGGKLIISVPIETGIAGLSKSIVRRIIRQEHSTNFSDILKSCLGIKIERKVEDGYIYSHTGFRYSDLEKVIKKENLKIKQRLGSPFRLFGAILNSQLFYVFETD